ncbi:MAG: choice-of-anchor tandem repeat GloVer-containing protein, partial [Terriglobales bacterium]
TNGEYPLAPLVQGRDGNLYGTSAGDGISDGGTVFKITTKGVLTTLHSFEGTDGFRPYAGLVQAADGNLYGTTYNGGTSSNGTAFKITPTNRLTVLHSFCQTDCTRRFDIFWTSEIAGEGARATLAYFPAVALPSSLASIAGLEQTS